MQLIYTIVLSVVMLGTVTEIEHKEQAFIDNYSWAEALPFEMLISVSDMDDTRPMIDRLTLDMIGEIPVTSEALFFDKQ